MPAKAIKRAQSNKVCRIESIVQHGLFRTIRTRACITVACGQVDW